MLGSRWLVGSSSISSGGAPSSARASAIRWRCPAERRTPSSPMFVSIAAGEVGDELARRWPAPRLARSRPREACGRPKAMFSATEPRIAAPSWSRAPAWRRSARTSIPSSGSPSTVSCPTRAGRDPAAAHQRRLAGTGGPRIATVSPASTVSETSTQHRRLLARVAEGHAPPRRRAPAPRSAAAPVGLGLGVLEHLVDPLDRRQAVEDVGQGRDHPVELAARQRQHRHEGDQVAERHRAVATAMPPPIRTIDAGDPAERDLDRP